MHNYHLSSDTAALALATSANPGSNKRTNPATIMSQWDLCQPKLPTRRNGRHRHLQWLFFAGHRPARIQPEH